MKELKLNTKYIAIKMKINNITKAGLAKKLGISRQAVDYIFKKRPISAADRMARYFKGNPKDYII